MRRRRDILPRMESPAPPATVEHRFPCAQCGAKLQFVPGTTSLKCPYCGFVNPIDVSAGQVEEQDFESQIAQLEQTAATEERTTVRCQACGAQTEKPANVTALACPFCGADIVMTGMSRRLIKPRALLPFSIRREQADGAFRQWIRKLWFAPNKLKRLAGADQSLSGMYVPFWTFDCQTTSRYAGLRGDDYMATETYTAYENGKPVTRTRTVVRTRWTPASGVVQNAFDDLLIPASESLPRACLEQLEPWDLPGLVPYDDAFLSGFRAESYTVDLPTGFAAAKTRMEGPIHASIRQDIGGDHQQIHSVHTRYSHVTFKHILLPVWISAYRYHDRVYRFLVNARTGEVQGERPYSAWKIAGLAAVLAVAAGVIVWLASTGGH